MWEPRRFTTLWASTACYREGKTRNTSYKTFCRPDVSMLPSLLISALRLDEASEFRELKPIPFEAI
jgi:hypothetical protein